MLHELFFIEYNYKNKIFWLLLAINCIARNFIEVKPNEIIKPMKIDEINRKPNQKSFIGM